MAGAGLAESLSETRDNSWECLSTSLTTCYAMFLSLKAGRKYQLSTKHSGSDSALELVNTSFRLLSSRYYSTTGDAVGCTFLV